MKKLLFFANVLYGTFLFAQTPGGGVSDINGKNYSTVIIGGQEWMAKNLDVDKFQNGDTIYFARTIEEWEYATLTQTPAWCYYDNDPANGNKYGKLYNWYAVDDPRGLAPKGWHIPTEDDWTSLTDYFGGEISAGKHLKNNTGWKDNEHNGNNGNGTNDSGFSGLPAGRRIGNGNFLNINKEGAWWGESEKTESVFTLARGLSNLHGYVNFCIFPKEMGLSVRCIKNINK